MAQVDGDEWPEYRNLVIDTLHRHTELLDRQTEQIADLKTENAMLKIKSGVWGVAATLLIGLPLIIGILGLLKATGIGG